MNSPYTRNIVGDLSACDRRYFEGVVILLELNAVTVEEALAPEQDRDVSVDKYHWGRERLRLVLNAEGKFADKPLDAFH